MNPERIAEIAHEVNRAYCESMGDLSQPKWADAPDWQKSSAIAGVTHHISNPNETPEGSHLQWMNMKRADGWRYGPVKDPIAKTHPCFLPYDELKGSDKAKDYLFREVVRQLKAAP